MINGSVGEIISLGSWRASLKVRNIARTVYFKVTAVRIEQQRIMLEMYLLSMDSNSRDSS